MTVAPQPTPNRNDQAPPRDREGRPPLHVVRPTEQPPATGHQAPPEDATEITGPIPRLDAHGQPIEPLAPWDVRARRAVEDALQDKPWWNYRPPSPAQAWANSMRGDWSASDKSVQRAVHAAATLAVFVFVVAPALLVLKFTGKPTVLVIIAALLYLLWQL